MRTGRRIGLGGAAAVALLVATAASNGANQLDERDTALAVRAAKPGSIPETGYGRYLAGRAAKVEGDVTAAADFLGRALDTDPSNESLIREAFTALLAGGRIDQALKLADIVLKGEPRSPIGNLVVGVADLKKGDYAKARAAIERSGRQRLNQLSVPLLIAWAHAGEGQHDAALKEIATLRNKAFAGFQNFHRGLISDLAGKATEAEAAYREAAGADAEGGARMNEALGNFLERRGRRDDAIALYKAGLARDPGNVLYSSLLAAASDGAPRKALIADAREGAAEALFGVGSALVQEGSLETAMIYVRLAIYLRPAHLLAQTVVGNVLEANQRWDAAIAEYRRVDPKSPYGWNARLRIAASLQRLEKYDDAAGILKGMADERKDRVDSVIALGDLHRGRENWKDAIAQYDAAQQRLGKLQNADWTLLYARGIALERSKQWERAETDFLKALELQPDQPLVLNYLGYSWVEQGRRLDEARQMIERAVNLRPRDGYIVDSLGWVLYRLGDYPGAVKQLERAIELRPEDPVINDHLGDAYWRVGRENEARFQWNRALSFKPEKDQIPLIEKKVKEGPPPAQPLKRGG